MYKVIHRFEDITNGRIYEVGDIYEGDRFDELSGSKNALKKPLIKREKTTKKVDEG